MAPLGALPTDVNEDGHMDVVVYYAGRTPLIFLWRPSSQSVGLPLSAANYVVRDIFPSNNIWMTGSATAADFDGDGHLDLIFANYFKDGTVIQPPRRGVVSCRFVFAPANGGGERNLPLAGSSAGRPNVTYAESPTRSADGAEVGAGVGRATWTAKCYRSFTPHDFGPDRLLWNRSTPGRIRFAYWKASRT